jgi:putative pyruvate formate lyase activating enzyme
MQELDHCLICPRECGVNRNAGQLGYCRSGAGYEIGSICIHRGEEPVISGEHGICNIFFTHCNLQCIFCQNYQISRNREKQPAANMSLDQVTEKVIDCLRKGAEAVGFVTPSHFTPHVRAIIENLNQSGYQPVTVYNSNGYDSVSTLKSLEGLIDVYLPDLKYEDPSLSKRYSDAFDYPAVAKAALKEMFRQKGSTLITSGKGQALNGLIIRHLVLPQHANDSVDVLKWIASELSAGIHISLMSQYNPTLCMSGHETLNRKLAREEYEVVVQAMDDLGFYNGWVQEPESSGTYNPDFRQDHPFE